MKKYIYALILFCFGIHAFGQTFTDTKGELQISNSGQATYTIPIAMPPSIKDVAPVINLVYSSGVRGGIMGQGWNISSISSITRIATRRDIDGFVDGVDFDDNDKLALDGQRLLIKTGTYWENNSTYETEYKSNTKIELKIEPSAYGPKTYFIITEPDGSRTYYGSTGNGMIQNAVSANAWYIIRHEDVYLNYITYVYQDYTYNNTTQKYIKEIKFSGNETQGIPQANKIVFQYVDAKRVERDYINGNAVYATKILDKVFVYTNEAIFRSYEMTRNEDEMGYERVSSVVEKNGLGEAANPIYFEYNTPSSAVTSLVERSYDNSLPFENIDFVGDFDGDGRLDFIANQKLYTNLFVGTATNTPVALPFNVSGIINTITNNKVNSFQSLLSISSSGSALDLKVYNFQNNQFVFNYVKTITNLFTDSTMTTELSDTPYASCYDSRQAGTVTTILKLKSENKIGDFDGNGISEILLKTWIEKKVTIDLTGHAYPHLDYPDCQATTITSNYGFHEYYIDLNPNESSTIDSNALFSPNPQLSISNIKQIADFNGDGKDDILKISGNTYTINEFEKTATGIAFPVIGTGIIDAYSPTKQMLFGDFNGDGKTDIMLPNTEGGRYPACSIWHIYYANPNPNRGSFFTKESHNIVEYWPNTSNPDQDPGYYTTQIHLNNFYAIDLNKDGKTDLLRINRVKYKDGWDDDVM